MKEKRFISADMNPSKDIHWIQLKKEALQLLQQAFIDKRQLHDDAAVAILHDYNDMGAAAFLKRLRTFSLILDNLKEKPIYEKMQRCLVNLLRQGINKVSGEALDAITVRRDAIQVDVDGKSTIIGSIDNEFVPILSIGKESRETQIQYQAVNKLIKQRNDESLQAVSHAFRIPITDTGKITLLVDSLFNEQWDFVRHRFDPLLDELAEYENLAFELLWAYFKAIKGSAYRIPFLNALQHLISRINRPKHALRLLLADFCRDPETVEPSDRNAIMLANILLRTYNKELDVDIEMTPEEVLNVRNGLDRDVVHYAQFRIDSVEYRFAMKVDAIHGKLVDRLHERIPDSGNSTIRDLLFIEREVYIFLSLLSGKSAHRILISALTEYGDPKNGIYRHLPAPTYLPVFLQHLKIIVRGVGRVGTKEDVTLLRQIGEYGSQLSRIDGTPDNQRAVARTLEWIENVIRNISADRWHSVYAMRANRE